MVPAQKKHIISWACRKIVKTSVLRNASPSKSIAQGKTLPMQSIAFQVSQGNDSINVISLYSHSSWSVKVIYDYDCFALLRSVIGRKRSRHAFNQTDARDLVTHISPCFRQLACIF